MRLTVSPPASRPSGDRPTPRIDPAIRKSFVEFLDSFDLIERESEAWADRHRAALASIDHALERANVKGQNNVELLVAIPAAGLVTRVRQLIDGMISLVNADNPHAAPPVARALFETCCLPIYLRRELVPRVQKGRTNAVHILVFKFGLGGIGSLSGHIKPISVDALITSARAELKALEAGVPEGDRMGAEELIDIYYGPLSELTHPNWAALTLGTSLDPAKPLDVPDRVGFMEGGVLHEVVASSAYILDRGGAAFDAVLDALSHTPMDLPNADPDWKEGDIRPP